MKKSLEKQLNIPKNLQARLIVRMYEEVIRNLDTENHRRTDTSGLYFCSFINVFIIGIKKTILIEGEFDPFRIGRGKKT